MIRIKSSFLVTTAALVAGVSIASAQGLSSGGADGAGREKGISSGSAGSGMSQSAPGGSRSEGMTQGRASESREGGRAEPLREKTIRVERNATSPALVSADVARDPTTAARARRSVRAGLSVTTPISPRSPIESATTARIAHSSRVKRTRQRGKDVPTATTRGAPTIDQRTRASPTPSRLSSRHARIKVDRPRRVRTRKIGARVPVLVKTPRARPQPPVRARPRLLRARPTRLHRGRLALSLRPVPT